MNAKWKNVELTQGFKCPPAQSCAHHGKIPMLTAPLSMLLNGKKLNVHTIETRSRIPSETSYLNFNSTCKVMIMYKQYGSGNQSIKDACKLGFWHLKSQVRIYVLRRAKKWLTKEALRKEITKHITKEMISTQAHHYTLLSNPIVYITIMIEAVGRFIFLTHLCKLH